MTKPGSCAKCGYCFRIRQKVVVVAAGVVEHAICPQKEHEEAQAKAEANAVYQEGLLQSYGRWEEAMWG